MKEKISRNKISRHYKSFFELENMALAEDDHLMIDWGESLIEHFVNQEVEKRIAERMPSEVLRGFFHELIQAGRDMNDRDRLGLPYLTDDMYFMDFEYRFRSRLTNDSLMIDWGESLINDLVNQEVERRIKERMPSEEEIEKAFTTEHYHWEQGRHYRVRKDRIFGAKWLRSRLTKPGAETSQKTEGGGE